MDAVSAEIEHHKNIRLEGADIGVVIAYFACVIGVGVFAMWRANKGTVSGYFLAGRSMLWLPVGASLFVSNIGSEHFIGLAGSGAARGISVGAWEFNAILLIQLLCWIFVPVYMASSTYTMPEYLSKRFGGSRLRVYFAGLSLVLYIFTKCSVDLYTGGIFIQQSLKWDLYLCIFVLIVITALLTVSGGLTAVIYTDTLQAFLMVGGAIILMCYSFVEVGGLEGMYKYYPGAVSNVTLRVPNTTCHETDPEAFKMLRSVNDDYMPWLGFLIGQTPGSIWYWCTDQVIVQRVLAAKGLSHVQGAGLMAGFIKILPLFIMVMPGMISRILFPDTVGCSHPDVCMEVCQSRSGCSNIAYPKLVLGLLPVGLRGLMMAVMIAALMSDLDSIFNSASTLFTIDLWKKIRKRASALELVIVGRVFVLVMAAVAIAWVPVVKETQGGQVFIYIQEITNYLAPPFAAIFLLAVLVPRVNEKGAFWALMAALVTGVARMIIVLAFPAPSACGDPDTRPEAVKTLIDPFHYMYFALLLFLMTGVIALVISFLTSPPDDHHLSRTTFWTRRHPIRRGELDTTEFDDIANGEKSCNPSVQGYDNPAMTTEGSGPVFTVEKGDGVKTFRDPEWVDPSQGGLAQASVEEVKCSKKVFNWFCGVRSATVDREKERKMEEHLQKIADLKQNRTAKFGLRVGLVFILVVGVFLYVFWSLWSEAYAEQLCGPQYVNCRQNRFKFDLY